MHARYFSANLGRFHSVDPVGGAPSWPQSWNRYSYVLGNPMKYTDPRGLIWEVFQQVPDHIPYWETIDALGSYEYLPGIASFPSRGPNTTSPWSLGWHWLTGTGQRRQVFRDGDPFTELLKEHRHVEKVVEDICGGARSPIGSAPYNLSGLQGVPKYLRDYSTLMTAGATGNLAVTYLGSYTLDYYMANGTVNMVMTNPSTAASGFRPPVLGYTEWWRYLFTGRPRTGEYACVAEAGPVAWWAFEGRGS